MTTRRALMCHVVTPIVVVIYQFMTIEGVVILQGDHLPSSIMVCHNILLLIG